MHFQEPALHSWWASARWKWSKSGSRSALRERLKKDYQYWLCPRPFAEIVAGNQFCQFLGNLDFNLGIQIHTTKPPSREHERARIFVPSGHQRSEDIFGPPSPCKRGQHRSNTSGLAFSYIIWHQWCENIQFYDAIWASKYMHRKPSSREHERARIFVPSMTPTTRSHPVLSC